MKPNTDNMLKGREKTKNHVIIQSKSSEKKYPAVKKQFQSYFHLGQTKHNIHVEIGHIPIFINRYKSCP